MALSRPAKKGEAVNPTASGGDYRTEVIDNTRNPDFVRKFVLDFFFEEKQNLRYNVDSRSCNISKHFFHFFKAKHQAEKPPT
ncbi:Copine-8 [Liparis tanakae]|uniref:Copine-8 n=1 Tax=Liparis tanakae TaxID=230148 RepID=A0A4Z2FDV3_9TELE|nr:Copine-8 [Liparis tanakae]